MKKRDLPSSHGKRAEFLANYAQTGNITDACKFAGIARSTHYEWMSDDDYAASFDAAHAEACDSLEAEARRRAVDGVEDLVIHQGEVCYHPEIDKKTGKPKRNEHGYVVLSKRPIKVRKYSDRLLEVLLKAHKPDKYRDNFKGEIATSRTGAVDLSGLSDAELDTLEAIARRLQGPAKRPDEELPKAA